MKKNKEIQVVEVEERLKKCSNPRCTNPCRDEQGLLPVSEFTRNKGKKDGLNNQCKKCDKERRDEKQYRSCTYVKYGKELDGQPFIYTGSCKGFSERQSSWDSNLKYDKSENKSLRRIFNDIKDAKGEDFAIRSINSLPIMHLYRYVPNVSQREGIRQLAEKRTRELIYFTLRSWGILHPEKYFLNVDEELNPPTRKKMKGSKKRKSRRIDWDGLEKKYLQQPFLITLESDCYVGEGKILLPILRELFKDVPREQGVRENY